ncbi:hypothetical protein PsB1_0333 [Candidatus Phycosocius spiralis]|uniref:Uncharacterized protein n=1 Tax=Candidatus Phycosocius spiralis TaxID=2815099 RepID=A0ABQ4PT72_9PROT|nr:hypothetical protein PsB1_0333 [Candidatus Phycosocius spiralis]
MRLILSLLVILGVLFYSNPTEERLREIMREQDKLSLYAASFLPIRRTNYYLVSKFEISYLLGTTTCWGAAYSVIICPEPTKSKAKS